MSTYDLFGSTHSPPTSPKLPDSLFNNAYNEEESGDFRELLDDPGFVGTIGGLLDNDYERDLELEEDDYMERDPKRRRVEEVLQQEPDLYYGEGSDDSVATETTTTTTTTTSSQTQPNMRHSEILSAFNAWSNTLDTLGCSSQDPFTFMEPYGEVIAQYSAQCPFTIWTYVETWMSPIVAAVVGFSHDTKNNWLVPQIEYPVGSCCVYEIGALNTRLGLETGIHDYGKGKSGNQINFGGNIWMYQPHNVMCAFRQMEKYDTIVAAKAYAPEIPLQWFLSPLRLGSFKRSSNNAMAVSPFKYASAATVNMSQYFPHAHENLRAVKSQIGVSEYRDVTGSTSRLLTLRETKGISAVCKRNLPGVDKSDYSQWTSYKAETYDPDATEPQYRHQQKLRLLEQQSLPWSFDANFYDPAIKGNQYGYKLKARTIQDSERIEFKYCSGKTPYEITFTWYAATRTLVASTPYDSFYPLVSGYQKYAYHPYWSGISASDYPNRFFTKQDSSKTQAVNLCFQPCSIVALPLEDGNTVQVAQYVLNICNTNTPAICSKNKTATPTITYLSSLDFEGQEIAPALRACTGSQDFPVGAKYALFSEKRLTHAERETLDDVTEDGGAGGGADEGDYYLFGES
jgi:hypothetical protein